MRLQPPPRSVDRRLHLLCAGKQDIERDSTLERESSDGEAGKGAARSPPPFQIETTTTLLLPSLGVSKGEINERRDRENGREIEGCRNRCCHCQSPESFATIAGHRKKEASGKERLGWGYFSP